MAAREPGGAVAYVPASEVAVAPLFSMRRLSAPAESSARTTSTRPRQLARFNGVVPELEAAYIQKSSNRQKANYPHKKRGGRRKLSLATRGNDGVV